MGGTPVRTFLNFLMYHLFPYYNFMSRSIMRRTFTILLLVTLFTPAFACDICGCNSGSYFIGPFPRFNRYFAGLRYSSQSYGTVLDADHSQFSDDLYQTTEFMAAVNIKSKWQVMTFIPYNFVYSRSDDGINRSNGFGDITVMGNFSLLDSRYLNRDTVTVSHQLWIGGGVKLPTGKFAVDPEELVTSANLQPGTGSYSYLLNLLYSYRIRSWGLNFTTNYRINQYSGHYRFGNRINLTSFVYRSLQLGHFTVSPNTGLLYETMAMNKNDGEKVADTGGNALLAAAGVEVRYGDLVFGCNDQIPLASDLSSGQTNVRMRAMFHLSFMF